MAEELKTRSFRIDDATSEQFKAISQEIGGNQQQALSKLLECYELQKGKVLLEDKKGDIETFENHMTSISNMFMTSLQDNQNMKENVRAEYDSLLKSKDETILGLQETVKTCKEVEEQSKEDVRALRLELDACKHNLEVTEKDLSDDRENYESIIVDKDKLNKVLTDANESLKKEIQGIDALKEQVKDMQSKYESLKEEYSSLQGQHNELKIELDRSKLEHEKAMLELERKHSQEVAAITSKYVASLEEKVKAPAKRPTKKKEPAAEQESRVEK